MILNQIMVYDLHKSKSEKRYIPWIEFQNIQIPCVVSGGTGKFFAIRKHHSGKIIKVGMFSHNTDLLNNKLNPMFSTALSLSKEEGWGNYFSGANSAERAFNYIFDNDNIGQPHICLMPISWSEEKFNHFFGPKAIDEKLKYKKYCKVIRCSVKFPVFCSRPDMVGVYTQIMGGDCGILLHNVKKGLAFCID